MRKGTARKKQRGGDKKEIKIREMNRESTGQQTMLYDTAMEDTSHYTRQNPLNATQRMNFNVLILVYQCNK